MTTLQEIAAEREALIRLRTRAFLDAANTPRFTVGQYRLSYKRNGRHGLAWAVTDAERQTLCAITDTEAQAQAVADALEAGSVDRYDLPALRRIAHDAATTPRSPVGRQSVADPPSAMDRATTGEQEAAASLKGREQTPGT